MATSARAGRLLGQFWIYTLLRIALFGALWGVLWLVNVRGMLGLLIAVLLSVPLSFVLLARPRAALASSLEQRAADRKVREDDLLHRLAGDRLAGDNEAGPDVTDSNQTGGTVTDATVTSEPDNAEGSARAKPAIAPKSDGQARP